MGQLDGRIVAITGAGNGIGREHALLMASEGASVVVNDLGGSVSGSGSDAAAAQAVVEEIVAAGGTAVVDGSDIATIEGAQHLLDTALDTYGGLDVLVNNAGILRDRSVVKMEPDDWDAVIRVHLRGHFCPLHVAAQYWKEEAANERPRKAAVINTSSTSGLKGNFGQSNYGAAKAGIASLTIIADIELRKTGVRVNAIAPGARTRMTANLFPDMGETDEGFDAHHPGNISPLVAYLAREDSTEAGRVYFVTGGKIGLFQPWHVVEYLDKDERWTIEELVDRMPSLDVELLPAFEM